MSGRSSEHLERGRRSYAERAWLDAHDSLSRADRDSPLGADDLYLLATSAYMLARDEEYAASLERAHHAYASAGDTLRAVLCAFGVGLHLALRREVGGATGWFGRAQRLLDRAGEESVGQGYLLLPVMFQHEAAGDYAAAAAAAGAAADIAQRFGDEDLFALSAQAQGYMLIKHGEVRRGLALLDEAMVAVTSGELWPPTSGIVYCGVILACQEAYELRRAREWTAALTRWCAEQPELVAFTGRCLVHRAEIMQLDGAWSEALEEARQAARRFEETMNPAAGLAHYRQGELLRLRGEFDAAEEAYREASRCGWEPQPGLAQLRLAQGRADVAAAAIRRAVGEVSEPLKRAGLLAADVEIMLATGDAEQARRACADLAELAEGYESAMLDAMVEQARGAVDLALGDASSALVLLRRAWELWHELEAPYEAARVRVLVGLACRALGDEDTAALELEAAHGTFEQLGARPDLARLDPLSRGGPAVDTHGLTARELEVLRLVAAGATNKAVAAELVVSERTIDRHVSNIFTKLGVSSRAAATAFAYEHQLL
jgi:ATP/maltotriose-dependent transcriptional regulator MalT